MFNKKKAKEEVEIDKKKVNDVLTLSKKILNVLYIFIIIIGIYALIKLTKETKIFYFIKSILKIVAPLFIGIIVAWMFDPLVKKMQKKGIKRPLGTTIVYILFIGLLAVLIGSIIPILTNQINEFASTSLPTIIDTLKSWIDSIFDKISNISSFDVNGMKTEVFNKIGEIGTSLTSNLPTITVNAIKSIFSGLGTIVIGLVIGFYLLLSFDNATDTIVTLLPEKLQKDTKVLANEINTSLRNFVTGALLDALFVFGFQWGMAGAAWATVIGQMISGGLAVYFLCHCRTVTLCLSHLKPHAKYIGRITALGAAPCSNQLAMMIVQIVMNKSLKYYGSLSVYGESIPIACVGIITKVNQVFMAFVIGISQGLQPIVSFNYGAGLYRRVKAAYMRALSYGGTLAVVAFLLFQLLPHQIIALFGKGSPEYFQFAQNYFHIFLFFTFLNFLQPISSNFFTAIGKPTRGMILSLTRQILFLLPLIIIFPLFVGIDGIMYAGPVADLMAAIVAITLGWKELRRPEYQG